MSDEITQPVETDPNPPAVETAAPAEVVTEPAPVETSPDAGAETSPKDGVQKRIDELTRKKYDAEREAQYWRSIAQAPPAAPVAPEVPEEPVKEPVIEDYNSYEEFTKAQTTFAVDQAMKAARTAEEQAKQEAEKQQAVENYTAKVTQFAEKMPDFYEKVYAPEFGANVSQDMVDTIQRADNGPEIAYYLSNNIDQAARIARLDPRTIGLEIGKISASLKPPATTKTTGAPPPVQPIVGGEAAKADPSKMSTEEWIAWRNKDAAARGLR
jgi:hypothetical protein